MVRYILDDLGFIEEISFGGYIECNNKSCLEYTGEIPEGYTSLEEWMEKANIRAYKIADDNLVYDEERAADLEKECRIYKDPKIVYETTLTEATGTIEVTGLDMVRDGGEYEFEFYHKEDTSGDLNITFNDISSDYYMSGSFINGSLSANGTPTCVYFYRQAMTRIYYGTGGGSDSNINFPATMKGRFYFVNNIRKTVAFELKNHFVVMGSQTIVDQCGVNGKQVENLTSIKFVKENSGNFVAGTRLIIRKK